MSPPVRQIIELNIQHFRRLVEMEQDSVERETIKRLLKEQEEALTRFSDRQSG